MNTIDQSSSLQAALAGLTPQTRPAGAPANATDPEADTLSLSSAAEAIRQANESAALQTPDEALLASRAAVQFVTAQPATAAAVQGAPEAAAATDLLEPA